MTAVMQPYLFPYPGYFSLVIAVDRFVFYDDVQYINRGYINRNRLQQGTFTVPLIRSSSRDLIMEKRIDGERYGHFRRKWFRGFQQQYNKAPYYEAALDLARQAFADHPESIAEVAMRSVHLSSDYLELGTVFSRSSAYAGRYDHHLRGQDRMLALLDHLNCKHYVNNIGGQHLYDEEVFRRADIRLDFLRPLPEQMPLAPYFPYSILHLIAQRTPGEIRSGLRQSYELITTD